MYLYNPITLNGYIYSPGKKIKKLKKILKKTKKAGPINITAIYLNTGVPENPLPDGPLTLNFAFDLANLKALCKISDP